MARVVVVGHGMVGHRFVEAAFERGVHATHELVVIGEEVHPAYDRVHLSSWFDGATAANLIYAQPEWFAERGITLSLGSRATAIDREGRTVTTDAGETVRYDHLVLATGSYPFVPPVDGATGDGCFVYRTLDDLAAIEGYAGGCQRGIVVGGGLLGLEAANALRLLGLTTTVVEFAPHLLAVQLDPGGGRALRREVEALGIDVRCDAAAKTVRRDKDGGVLGLELADGTTIDADMVVFATGVRPRDELAREAGLEMGVRGGVVIDDTCTTSDSSVTAIGECACHAGMVYGLVAPGYAMAAVVADRLAGGSATFTGADLSTTLKLLDVEVASFGDAHARGADLDELVYADPRAGVYKKLVVDVAGAVRGGVLVGDTSSFAVLTEMARGTVPTPSDPAVLVAPALAGAAPALGITSLPDGAGVCSCHNVAKGAICRAIVDGDLADVAAIKAATKAGTGCGSCLPVLKELLAGERAKAGKPVSNHLCEHFAYSRQELFDIVRIKGITSFSALLAAAGRGRGCELCKPVAASMLASMANGYVLDGEQATLQDTNDHLLANLQRDGTYSVVPRVPGGEIRPEQLVVIGEVARDFDLYTKVTGAQRIDLFGARVDQLPAIWRRLIDAGFESGHAYGKALRTVKSCVGTTWCRYGVQDAVSMAIALELRYRGLRAPHKIKMAVSGCARECAEAQGKDVGVIATEQGWNLYVCGNGGMRPQHAVLLAEDLDDATLVRSIDRFLAYYIRTAGHLERTAPWFNKLDGGLDHLRAVVMDDSLSVAAELEADIARHVERYECEWKATLESPERMARFRHFLNTDEPDPDLAYTRERGQRIPIRAR